jgi:hypothetical protein
VQDKETTMLIWVLRDRLTGEVLQRQAVVSEVDLW